MGKLIVTKYKGGVLSFLTKDGRGVQLLFSAEKPGGRLGEIRRARVINVNPNIRAAFVCLDGTQMAFLPYAEGDAPKPQQEITVQVTQEAVKTKLPTASKKLTLPGRYLVLTMDCPGLRFSHKLAERSALEPLLREILEASPARDGFIVRTNAPHAAPEELRAEAWALMAEAERIRVRAEHSLCFERLYAPEEAFCTLLRDLPAGEVQEAVTDDLVLYEALQRFAGEELPSLSVRLYEDAQLPLAKLYSLETEVEKALAERVWLPSGAYLLIEPTETMTVVDVNSGKTELHRSFEETVERVNREAAAELMRQIRLRNIGGMILTDFINMKSEEANASLMAYLRELAAKDPVLTQVVDMTALGLVEITRRSLLPPFREQLKAALPEASV